MLNKSTVQLMALGLVGSLAANAAAQDSGALIDALVRKGVLKDQEAEQIRSQLSRDFAANTSAGKLNLSSSVKELKLSGDVRARFQYDTKDAQQYSDTKGTADTSNVTQRDRFRLRLRVNADYKLNDNFFAGFGLQTEQKSDSGNQTMAGGAGGTGTSAAGDYFQNYSLFVSKAFIGWTPVEGVTLVGGKQSNPLYTTDMVWDADINPTGFSQRIDFHKFFELGRLELSLVGVQGIVADNAESGKTSSSNRDAWVYHTQLIAAMKVADGLKITVAPGYYCSNGASLVGDGGGESNFGSSTTWNTSKAMEIYTAPGDVSFKVAGMPVKFVWDFALNSKGGSRTALYNTSPVAATVGNYVTIATNGNNQGTVYATSTAAGITSTGNKALGASVTGAPGGGSTSTAFTVLGVTSAGKDSVAGVTLDHSRTDDMAYLLGIQVGENKKKGDWSILANYRQVGLASVDPNINDSDWSLSYTNMSGYKAGFAYNLGDATTIGLTYYYGDNLRKDIGVTSGGFRVSNAGPQGSGSNSVQVLQLDVSVKF